MFEEKVEKVSLLLSVYRGDCRNHVIMLWLCSIRSDLGFILLGGFSSPAHFSWIKESEWVDGWVGGWPFIMLTGCSSGGEEVIYCLEGWWFNSWLLQPAYLGKIVTLSCSLTDS